jgi:AAA+ ATPase superfamily predicted ATPase
MDKPGDVFDRDDEWADLADFVGSPLPGMRLAVVYGRRRQGKSYVLRRLAEACGGLYHLATEQAEPVSLRRFADSLAAWADLPAGMLMRVGDFCDGGPAVRYEGTARQGRARDADSSVRLPGCTQLLGN